MEEGYMEKKKRTRIRRKKRYGPRKALVHLEDMIPLVKSVFFHVILLKLPPPGV